MLFSSSRESKPTQESKFYEIAVTGGTPDALIVPRAVDGQLSADGKMIG